MWMRQRRKIIRFHFLFLQEAIFQPRQFFLHCLWHFLFISPNSLFIYFLLSVSHFSYSFKYFINLFAVLCVIERRNMKCEKFTWRWMAVGWNEWEMIISNEFLRCLHEELKIKAFLFCRNNFFWWIADVAINYFIHKNKR